MKVVILPLIGVCLLSTRLAFSQSPATIPLDVAVADSLDQLPLKSLLPAINYWGPDRGIMPKDKGIIYGSCVQRLGFSSGGFGQYVRLYNLTSGKAMRLEVKPAFKSAKQNLFCVALPPGRYALHLYEYTESKWYGGEMQVENIRKTDSTAVRAVNTAATRYVFTIVPGELHYLGTWHLDKAGQPYFSDDKITTDEHLRRTYKKLDLDKAQLVVPR